MPTDFDECEENTAGCEQNCTNFDGGYNCTCGSGYTLATDLHNCLGKLLCDIGQRSIYGWEYL